MITFKLNAHLNKYHFVGSQLELFPDQELLRMQKITFLKINGPTQADLFID